MEDLMGQAIGLLRPDATFGIRNGDELEWLDTEQTQPTDAEIQAEVTRLQAEYDSQEYARDRAEAYPSLNEQADMAYWDRQNGTTTLDDAISAVKLQFPKETI
jgi:hypothetical protein